MACYYHKSRLSMKLKSLQDLLVDQLKDLYSAENQLVKALPKMAKAATNPDLKAGFTEHLEQTRGQVARLERVCEQLGVSPKGKKCAAMEGLVTEGKELMEEDAEPGVLDAGLIAAAQKVEHYEISGYGTARTLAGQIGQAAIAQTLMKTLAEEEVADNLLTQIARELMGGLRTGAGTTAAEDEGVTVERDIATETSAETKAGATTGRSKASSRR